MFKQTIYTLNHYRPYRRSIFSRLFKKRSIKPRNQGQVAMFAG